MRGNPIGRKARQILIPRGDFVQSVAKSVAPRLSMLSQERQRLPEETYKFASWLLTFLESYPQDGRDIKDSQIDLTDESNWFYFHDETRDLKEVLVGLLKSYVDDSGCGAMSATGRLYMAVEKYTRTKTLSSKHCCEPETHSPHTSPINSVPQEPPAVPTEPPPQVCSMTRLLNDPVTEEETAPSIVQGISSPAFSAAASSSMNRTSLKSVMVLQKRRRGRPSRHEAENKLQHGSLAPFRVKSASAVVPIETASSTPDPYNLQKWNQRLITSNGRKLAVIRPKPTKPSSPEKPLPFQHDWENWTGKE